MRVQSVVLLAAIVCLLPLSAAADISRVSPSSLQVGNVEEFLSIFGSGLSGTELTRVVFDGKAGHFEVEPGNFVPSSDPNAIPQFPDNLLQVWVPVDVAITVGTYQVTGPSSPRTSARTRGSPVPSRSTSRRRRSMVRR
jgi:hypothetical protein